METILSGDKCIFEKEICNIITVTMDMKEKRKRSYLSGSDQILGQIQLQQTFVGLERRHKPLTFTWKEGKNRKSVI